jgi:hypothetical protein
MKQHYYQTIQGWADFLDIYKQQVAKAPPIGAHFVEIGAWKGRSAAYMAVEIENSGKQIQFDVIDTWLGSEEHQSGAAYEDAAVVAGILYEEFEKNLLPSRGYYWARRGTSQDLVKQYLDQSLDFVMIDAGHDYVSVSQDIQSWLPKMKPGSILAGDDISPNWPGVERAVHDCLATYQVVGSTWIYQVK